jgi:hypothetical protein
LLFAKNEKIADTLLFAKNEKNVIFIPKSGHNFVIHNFIDFLTGITTPKDGGFRSWVEALYELTSLNMVTITEGSDYVGIKYSGAGRVQSRAILKSNDNPEGYIYIYIYIYV